MKITPKTLQYLDRRGFLLAVSRLVPILAFFRPSYSMAGSVSTLALATAAEPANKSGLKKSDVSIRSLIPHEATTDPSKNTIEAIQAFHATRLEWTYGLSAEFVSSVKKIGVKVGGAANPTVMGGGMHKPGFEESLPAKGGDISDHFGVQDLNGRPTTAPWFGTNPAASPWLCFSNAEVRDAYIYSAKQQIAMGIDFLQCDDAGGNSTALSWGACFCPRCMTAFRGFLQQNASTQKLASWGINSISTFDYSKYLQAKGAPAGKMFKLFPGGELKDLFTKFQEQTMIDFYTRLRNELSQKAGKYIPLSFNNGVREMGRVFQTSDSWVGELQGGDANPKTLYGFSVQSKKLGHPQTVSMPLDGGKPETTAYIKHIRNTLATTYALGLQMEVPWDISLNTPDGSRFFGSPSDFADLYAFIRANESLFDDYTTAGYTDSTGSDPANPGGPIVEIPRNSADLYGITRVKPGNPKAPVVVHLIDWSNSPSTTKVKINEGNIFSGESLRVRLLTAPPFSQAAHQAANKSGDFSGLSGSMPLEIDTNGLVSIPALSPWGMLILERADS